MIINNKPLPTGLRSVLFSSGLGLGHVKIVLNTDTIYTIEIIMSDTNTNLYTNSKHEPTY